MSWVKNCPNCGKEQKYTSKYYFQTTVKNNTKCHSCKQTGRKLSEEHKMKISKTLIGRTFSEEHKRKISESNCGKTYSDETKRKMSESHKGKFPSEETKQKMRENRPDTSGRNNPMYGKTGKNHPRYGKKHSKKTKLKIGAFHKGKIISEETKKKLSNAQSGKNNGFYGKTHTKETKQKMKNAWVNRKLNKGMMKNMRLSAIKRIEKAKFNGGQLMPGYNSSSIPIIEEYGKKCGYNFQHAENGGEFHLKDEGYWADGYDKEKNVWIEYYENAHKRTVDHDENRKQNIIERLRCEFIEIKEWENVST